MICVIDPPQGNGIHPERNRELVDRALEREEVWQLRRRAHEPRSIAVGMHDRDLRRHVGTSVETGRRIGASHHIAVGSAGDLEAFVDQRCKSSRAIRADAEPVPSLGPIGGDGEALAAGRDQLHRAIESPGRHGDDGGPLGERAARAEGAAGIG